jgi:hypothetical protein
VTPGTRSWSLTGMPQVWKLKAAQGTDAVARCQDQGLDRSPGRSPKTAISGGPIDAIATEQIRLPLWMSSRFIAVGSQRTKNASSQDAQDVATPRPARPALARGGTPFVDKQYRRTAHVLFVVARTRGDRPLGRAAGGDGALRPDAGGDARGRAFGGAVLGGGRHGDENDAAWGARHPGAAARVGFVVSWPLALRVSSAHERVRRRN